MENRAVEWQFKSYQAFGAKIVCVSTISTPPVGQPRLNGDYDDDDDDCCTSSQVHIDIIHSFSLVMPLEVACMQFVYIVMDQRVKQFVVAFAACHPY